MRRTGPALLVAAVLVLAHAGRAQAAPPANDAFAAPQGISGTAGTVTGTNVDATKETNEPDHAGYAGGASVWYVWTATTTGGVSFDTVGTGFGTLLAIYTGSSVGSLALVSARDPYHSNLTAASFRAVAGTTYRIAVDAPPAVSTSAPATGAITLNWRPGPANDDLAGAQQISGQSGSVAADTRGATMELGEQNHGSYLPVGGSVWFKWTAPSAGRVVFETGGTTVWDTTLAVYSGGAPTLTYVTENDNLLPSNWFSRVAFTAVAGTTYLIAVAGKYDTTLQNPFTGPLVVAWRPGPANDDLAGAQAISGSSGSIGGTNVGASRESGEPLHAGQFGSGSIWYRWTAPAAGRYVFRASVTGIQPLLAVYTGTSVGSLTKIAAGGAAAGASAGVAFAATAGASYAVAIDTVSWNGTTDLSWLSGPANDDVANAQPLSGLQTTATVSSVGGSAEPGEPSHAGRFPTASVWFRWTPPAGGYMTIDTIGSDFDTVVAVYPPSASGWASTLASDDDSAGSKLSRVSFYAAAGQTVLIAVDGGSGGKVVLRVNAAPSNDAFNGARAIDDELGTAVQGTLGATKQPGEPAHAGQAGGASVWYVWQLPASGTVTLDTAGSDFDTVLAVYRSPYPGAGVADLRLQAENDNFGSGGSSRVTVSAGVWDVLYVAVDGKAGATGRLVLNWALQVQRPANDDLAGADAIQGQSGEVRGSTLSATGEPGEPNHSGVGVGRSVWYRWTAPWGGRVSLYRGGGGFTQIVTVYTGGSIGALTEVARTTFASLEVPFTATAGTTYLIAVDGCSVCSGTKITGPVYLTWALAPQNDDFASAESLSGASGLVAGSTDGATKEAGEPNHANDPGGASVWYRWTAPVGGTVRFSFRVDVWGSTLVHVYRGATLAGLQSATWSSGAQWVTLYLGPAAGTTYVFAVDHEGGRTGPLTVTWSTPGYTATGTAVAVNPADAGAPGSSTTLVRATFATVSQAGITSAASSTPAVPPPTGYVAGAPARAYTVTTDAATSGQVEICVDTTGDAFPAGAKALFRLEAGVWIDRTTSVDAGNRLACGMVAGLGTFAVFAEDSTAPVTQATVTTEGTESARAADGAVTVQLTATDGGGSGVREITFSAEGAETVKETTVAGDSVTITLTVPGETTIGFAATDEAGNVESWQMITVAAGGEQPPTE